MRAITYSKQFKKDIAKAEKRSKDITKLKKIIELLVENKPLSRNLYNHPLKNNWKGYYDLHIEPDWILIYRSDKLSIHLERTGTHADLFE